MRAPNTLRLSIRSSHRPAVLDGNLSEEEGLSGAEQKHDLQRCFLLKIVVGVGGADILVVAISI